MLISHEVPVSLLQQSRSFNDYDYCLVHHYLKYPKYREYFRSLPDSRMVILDNSVVELGESFNLDLYLQVADELNPSIIIAPDDFILPENNFNKLIHFLSIYRGRSLVMGVPHGKNLEQYLQNFKEMSNLVPVIGISVHSFINRFDLIQILKIEDLIDRTKHHHLLGCQRPQEFAQYRSERVFLKSVDTSNPVIHGFYGDLYTDAGLDFKRKENIDTIIDQVPTPEQTEKILYNITKFRSFLHGNNN